MENIYTVYTKIINGLTFYFVKKYKTIPEYNDLPPILESYGMHSDFDKACSIAMTNSKPITSVTTIQGSAENKIKAACEFSITQLNPIRILRRV